MNEYSQRMLAKILEQRPDWSDSVTTREVEGEEYFAITIASPVTGQPSLEIESYRDELSVYWGDWHTHMPLWGEDEVDHLFELLGAIVSEEGTIVCEYRNDDSGERKWAGSTYGPIDSHDPPEQGLQWVMMSWLGTHSKTIDRREE